MDRPVTNYGALPSKPQDQADTEPEPFGMRTDRRCYLCGRGYDEYQAGTVEGARRYQMALRHVMSEAGYEPAEIDRLLARTDTGLTWLV